MAMKEQPARLESRRSFSLVRLIVLLIGLLLITISAIVWLLSNAHVIEPNWSNILSIIFAVLGIVLTFIFWLFPFPSNSPKEESYSAELSRQAVSTTNSQHLSLSQAQQIQQIQNVQTLQQFFPLSDPSELQRSASTNMIPQSSATKMTDSADKENNPEKKNITVVDAKNIVDVTQHLSKQRASLLDPEVIFQFNIALPNSTAFYGRVRAIETLISRTRNGGSTSIIGPRRIGKTWLMNYLHLIASQKLGSHFRLSYVDATMPSCATKRGFIVTVIEELVKNTYINPTDVGLDTLEKVVKDLRLRDQVPVLCIDEFEGLCNPREFDLSFFSGLRAIGQSGLVLVVASKHSLSKIVADNIKTSPFFNVFGQLTLKSFTKEEAESFVSDKSRMAGFTQREQQYLLEYGQVDQLQWPPLRLQLAGKILLEDKNDATINESYSYHPDDIDYWADFKRRLEEGYRGAIGT